MVIDVSAFLGAYPFRNVPGGTRDGLLDAMDRVGIDEAWVSYLPAMFWRDPMEGNAPLYHATNDSDRLRPVPAVHPGLTEWRTAFDDALERGVPAVRCDPEYYALAPDGGHLTELLAACGAAGVTLLVAVRLEDARQRHPNDRAAELAPWHVRSFVRRDPSVRLLVTGADRSYIEQVHFGSTPTESGRITWDISWVWGPPDDDLATLLDTVGSERFVFGTGQPLRLPEAVVAKLDLIERPGPWRGAVEAENALRLAGMRGHSG
jgi:hypothetical protein